MLKVYVDDSNVGEDPVSVLAGWAADEGTWVSFEKEWSAALGISPKLGHMLTHTIGLSHSAVVSGERRGELRLSPADVLVCGPAGGVARVRYTCASRGASGRRSFVPACEPDSSQQRSLITLDAIPGGAAASEQRRGRGAD